MTPRMLYIVCFRCATSDFSTNHANTRLWCDVNIIYSSMSAIQENTVCYLWLDIQLNDVDRTRIENLF